MSLHLIKCLCQGPPRVGKTHIKHLLLGKILEDTSSTGCAEHPERAIRSLNILEDTSSSEYSEHAIHSCSPGNVPHNVSSTSAEQSESPFRSFSSEKFKVEENGKTWEVMDNDKMTSLIAKKMSQLKQKEEEDDEAQSKVSNESTTDDTIEEGPIEMTVITDIKRSLMQDDLSPLPVTSDDEEWIYFIDSGGQPQFQEVLQAFIPNTSVLLLAIKLTEKLSNCPLMEYEKSGVKYSLGHHALSNQQILIRLAKMISSSESNMQIALAGTYYDEYVKTDTPSETMEEKEQQLQEIFSSRKDDLIFRDSTCQNVIFPVNGLQAEVGKFDDPVVCQLRSSITSTPYAIQIDVPLRWHAFELAIQAEAKRMGTQVLSLEKCIEISEALNFPPDDVIPALTFLSNYNLILYYASILPNVVFATPQVLLDKVTELTECVYQLSNPGNCANQPHATRGEYKTMRDYGITSIHILKDFSKHYVPGLFTETDLIKIFEHLYIFARHENGKYFMPALLPPFIPAELDQLLNPSTPPLLFHFEDSCAPAGLFCALIVCLSSQSISWKVRHDIKPLMGTKSNAVCFQIPGLRLVITLADSFNQFEVHYRCAEGYEKYLPKITEVVSEGLEEVVHNRKFNIKLPKKAFFCRACNDTPTTRRHIATPALEEKELVCSMDPINGCKMNDIESKWLEPLPLPSVHPDGPTIENLMEILITVSPEWNIFGMALRVPEYKRENIGMANMSNEDRLMKVLEYWGRNATHSNPFTWQTIVNILSSDIINNNKLAGEIQQKYLKK